MSDEIPVNPTQATPPDAELYFKSFFMQHPLPMWIYEQASLRFLEINAAALELYGYAREEFLSMGLDAIRPPEDIPALLHHLAHAAAERCGAWRHRRKNGSLLSVQVSARAMNYQGRDATLAVIQTLPRPDAHDSFRRPDTFPSAPTIPAIPPVAPHGAEHLQQVFAGIADHALFLLDAQGHITHWNADAAALTGYAEEDVLGRHWSIFYSPDPSHPPSAALEEAAKKGYFQEETWRRRQDGGMFWAHVLIRSLAAEDGALQGFLVLKRELTARKHREDALQASRNYLQAIINAEPECVKILNQEGMLIDMNPAGLSMIEADSLETVAGCSVYPLVAPEQRAAYRALIEQACGGGKGSLEFQITGLKGGRRWLQTHAVPFIGRNGEAQMLAMTRDITERKRVEAEIQQLHEELEARVAERTKQLHRANADLLRLNQEMESFSYSVSHDLRAPLRAIEGFSQIVQEDHAHQLDERGQGHLARIRAASARMAELIDNLLSLSRITRSEMHCQRLDLGLLAQEILQEMQASDPARQIEWCCQKDCLAEADPHLMRIALDNLLRNAWKFTRRQPSARLEFGCLRRDGEDIFYVRDNGAGFDMNYAYKLFTPFQRLHAANEFEGSGVGLATVRRIVRRHGGKIWAESQIDAGASFYFTLAAAPAIPHP